MPGRPLRLDDAALIAAALPWRDFAPSEHRFANLWLFRDRHRYSLVEEPIPYIRGLTYDGVVHALPLADLEHAHLIALAADGVACLYPTGAEALTEHVDLPRGFVAADSDYWYDAGRLATLAGAKTRRAQARRFADLHAPTWEAWNYRLADDAVAVLNGWALDVGCAAGEADLEECREAIRLAAPLELQGGLVRTGAGEPVAFLLASRCGDACVVHFAKGRRAYSDAYPWMFATFARDGGARFISFEQDLGNPGFARSKRSYVPLRLQPKYRLGLAQLR